MKTATALTNEQCETINKLRKFVKIRNSSGFQSNLQFQIDAIEAGLSVSDFPKVQKIADNHYVWDFPFGRLTELYGTLQFQLTGEY